MRVRAGRLVRQTTVAEKGDVGVTRTTLIASGLEAGSGGGSSPASGAGASPARSSRGSSGSTGRSAGTCGGRSFESRFGGGADGGVGSGATGAALILIAGAAGGRACGRASFPPVTWTGAGRARAGAGRAGAGEDARRSARRALLRSGSPQSSHSRGSTRATGESPATAASPGSNASTVRGIPTVAAGTVSASTTTTAGTARRRQRPGALPRLFQFLMPAASQRRRRPFDRRIGNGMPVLPIVTPRLPPAYPATKPRTGRGERRADPRRAEGG